MQKYPKIKVFCQLQPLISHEKTNMAQKLSKIIFEPHLSETKYIIMNL